MAGLGGWGLLALPPARAVLEASLPGHMVGQIGLLVAAGWLLGRSWGPVTPGELGGWNRYGATGLVVAIFTLAFWILPLSLDTALQDPAWETAKFLAVPLLAGLPLCRSWSRLPGLARALLWAHLIPMLAVMGWIYHEAPVRLCNAYLLDQQALLAWTLWGIAAAITAFWTIRAFLGQAPLRKTIYLGERP